MRVIALALVLLLAGCAQPGDDTDGPDGDPTDGGGPPTDGGGTPTDGGTPTNGATPTDAPQEPTWSVGPEGSEFQEDFEQGIDAWGMDHDVPDDPNREGDVAWHIRPTDEEAHSGNWSIRFTLDGRQDDGTIWIERTVGVPEDQAYDVDVTFWAWSRSESFNTLAYAVAYLGPDDPEQEEDFPGPQENSAQDDLGYGGLRETLDQAEGWKAYNFTWRVPADLDEVHVAFGISAVWETEMWYPFDDIEVAFTPVE